MFTNNINPVMFSIGPLEIRYYSLAYILGFVLCIWILLYFSKKKEIPLDKEGVYDYVFYIMLGVIIGSRLGEV